MKRRHSPRHGFTLLEILVALVIFVGSVAVISRLVSLGLDNADYARLQGEGVLLVESKFAEIDAGMEDGEGVSGDSFPGWTTEAGNESVGNFLYRITVTARHTTGATVAMTHFFFDEEEAEEAMAQQESSASGSSSSGSSSSSSSSSGAGGS
jgi:prepilin-type N-terminal cleavage/methylation domain-containing protein